MENLNSEIITNSILDTDLNFDLFNDLKIDIDLQEIPTFENELKDLFKDFDIYQLLQSIQFF